MNAIPTFRELELLGADAGAFMDAAIWEVERAIPMARSKNDRDGLADDLRRLNRLHRGYFHGAAA